MALEVAMRVPVVALPIDDEARNESTNLTMFAKKEVEVALVAKRFTKVEVAEEVAEIVPTTKFPIDEDEIMAPP